MAPTTRLFVVVAALCLYAGSARAQVASPAIRHVALDTFVFVTFDDGSVMGWGREEYPLAAREPSAGGYVLKPMPIVLPVKVRQMATSGRAAYALLEDGTVLAWGNNESGLLGSGMKTVSGLRRVGRVSTPQAACATTGACGCGAGTSLA